MSKQWCLIVGCQRSGTTLVRLLLSAHSEIASLDENLSYAFLNGALVMPELGESVIAVKAPRVTEQLTEDVWSDHDLAPFRSPYNQQPVIAVVRDVRATVASMITTVTTGSVWLDKWGLPSLHAWARRKQNVWEQWRAQVQGLPPEGLRLASAAFYWRYKTEAVLSYMKGGLPILVVRYEDLVERPDAACQAICAHIGVRWEAAMLEPAMRSRSEIDGEGRTVGGTDPARSVDCASVARWRELFDEETAAWLCTLAGPSHEVVQRGV